MQPSQVTLRAARDLGMKPLFYLGVYRLMLKSGLIRRRTPASEWESIPPGTWLKAEIPHNPEAYVAWRESSNKPFFVDRRTPVLDQIRSLHRDDIDEASLTAERILNGIYTLFGDEEYELGFPPSWNSAPSLISNQVQMNLHWTEYELEHFSDDARLRWEPSRFAWAFVLARANLLTDEAKFADGFWKLLQSWREENAPNTGPQWISAQEAAIRILGLVFCFYAFYDEFRTRPERGWMLAQTIAVHAARIPPTITYSLAQRNNHLLLEAVALYTAGVLFPEFRSATRWRVLGRRLFITGVVDQFFLDGGYIQHSTNYHRLALEASLWMLRLAQLHGEDFPDEIFDKLRKSVRFLLSLVDRGTGRVPNAGHNDGAYLFPLTNCAFQDYRPTLHLAGRIFDEQLIADSGSWEELSLWFGFPRPSVRSDGASQIQKPIEESQGKSLDVPKEFPQAGFILLQGKESRGFLRCVDFTSRPAHSDQLHFDLWWNGMNLIRDAGTYLYNGADPWGNSLAFANVHNAPLLDGIEPMDRRGSFLWLNWSRGGILDKRTSARELIEVVTAQHDGYRQLDVRVTRTVIRAGDLIWIVVDDLLGAGRHSLTIGWLIPDVSYALEEGGIRLTGAPSSFRVHLAGENPSLALLRGGAKVWGEFSPRDQSVLGWYSPAYARKDPALHLLGHLSGKLPLRLITTIAFGDTDPEDVKLNLADPGEHPRVVSSVSYMDDHLKD